MHVHVLHFEISDVKHSNITQRCNNFSYDLSSHFGALHRSVIVSMVALLMFLQFIYVYMYMYETGLGPPVK